MNHSAKVFAGVLAGVLLTSCGRPAVETPPQASNAAASPVAPSAVIDRWNALMPEEDSFQRPPPQIGLSRGNGMDGVGGLIDDTGSGSLPGQTIDHSSPLRAQQFGSSAVVDGVDGRTLDLDGYVVPLAMNDAGQVDELLFVPFYGGASTCHRHRRTRSSM
jgi:hypothetical protein